MSSTVSADYLRAYLESQRAVWYVVDVERRTATFTTTNPSLVPDNAGELESGEIGLEQFPTAVIEAIHSLRKDSQSVWCRWNTDGGNWMNTVIHRISDAEILIIARAAIEEAGVESETDNDLFTRTFDIAPVGLAYVDSNGVVIRANPEFAHMVGYSKQGSLTGKALASFVFAPDVDGVKNGLNQMLTGDIGVYNCEARFERADGERRWYRLRLAHLRVKRDARFRTLVMLFDVHHQVVRDEVLTSRVDQLRSIIDYAGGGVVFGDSVGRVLSANNAFCGMLGYTEEDIVGLKVSDFTHPEDSRKEREMIANLLEKREDHYRLEKRYLRADGTYVWTDVIVSVIWNKDHTPRNFIGVVQDITKSKEQEKALRELNATKNRVFSIIGHDLKNPINSILGLTELAVESIERNDAKDSRDIIEMIRTSVTRAHDLLVNMLDWSRTQEGRIPFTPEEMSASEALWKVSGLVASMAHQKGINVMVKADSEIEIMADRAMLRSILINLLTNAIKYTEKGGEVRATVHLTDEGVEYIVEDNGVGMSQSQLRDLFILGEQESQRGTNDEPGTGLGIMVVRDFVERHGSELHVQSELGKGSRFSFVLQPAPVMLQNVNRPSRTESEGT